MARVMEIKTPLPDGMLLFYSMTASEALGRLFEYEITLLSLKSDVKPEDLLGKNVTVKLELPDGGDRFFDACVTRFGLTGGIGRYFRYQLTGRPWAWLMTRKADCRIFQKKSVPDIVKEIFGNYPGVYKFNLTGEHRPWEYCVQYRETDFNFVSRLMEQEGIYYYFKHEQGKHTMLLADSYDAHEVIKGYEKFAFLPQAVDTPRRKEEVIEEWFVSKQVQPGAYVIDDYDFERPSVELETTYKDARKHTAATGEIYDWPGEYIVKEEGEHFVRTRLEELLAQHEVCEGSGTTRAMCTGSLFNLTLHPRADQNREYLVTGAQYRLQFEGYEGLEDTGGDYRCSFTAMPSSVPFRPARSTPKPIVQGPQTAVVVGPAGDEIHTDKYGRVKVHFHWDRHGRKDENDTTWIRVSHPWAGKGWGAISIPRIGQEVIVDFLEGDPDQPIITGRVYNAETMPPFGLPGAGVISGIKSNTHRGRGYNEMTMDDTAGKEKITIHAQYDMGTTVQHDQTNTVNNDFTETIKNNAKIEITKGTYRHDVKTSTAKYHVQGALTETYDATQTTTVKNNITITSTAGAIAISSDAQHVYINAATSIQLHVGASMIWMDAGGQINISGVNVAINGSAAVTIKGGIVHSEAQSEHQTKGAIVLSEGSATNTVKGGMVMLNP